MANGYQSKRTGADVDRLLDKIDEFNPATKVDKVSGKQLSTEDFTTALKQKLQGLENYDDTDINNAIAGKQDKINDLDTIRAGAAKGATALQEHQDISHLATKEEVTQGLREKVEKSQVGELNLALVDGLDNGSLAYALPDSANGDEDDVILSRNSVKTVNGKSIYGKGNIYIPEYDDTHLDLRVYDLEQNKADKEGVYPEMSVGLAEDLGGRPFFEDAEFVFRASAGEDYSIKDGLASIQSIKGNSVVWNQINDDPYFLNSSIWTSSKITLTINSGVLHGVVSVDSSPAFYGNMYNDANHIYVYTIDYIATEGRCYIYAGGNGANLGNNTGTRQVKGIVFKSGANSSSFSFYPNIEAPVGSEFDIYGIRLYDLTQMFGAGNEPTTIEEFYARIPSGVDMNAYNAGEVIHMNTESIKSVGENLFNKEKAIRGYIENNQFIEAEWSNRYGLLMRCIPNTEYYLKDAMNGYFLASAWFYDANMNYIEYDYVTDNSEVEVSSGIITTADNAAYMVVFCNQDYIDSCMVSLVHSGWKQDVDAGYQPYWEDRLDLSVIGKYFPQGMKKAGSAYDEIRFNKASGKWEAVRRIGEVDMGSLEWVYNNVAGQYRFYSYGIQNSIMKPNSADTIANIVCSRYIPDSWNTLFVNLKDKIVATHTGSPIAVFDSAYTDAASFKAAMSGVMLYYELAEPIVTEIEEDIELIYDVADFGTEEAIASVPSTPFRARIMYDFNANDSIRNNSVTIRELKRIIAELTNRINSLESNQQ